MTYFVLPQLNNKIEAKNIKLQFSDNNQSIKTINPSLKKYLNIVKNLIEHYLQD